MLCTLRMNENVYIIIQDSPDVPRKSTQLVPLKIKNMLCVGLCYHSVLTISKWREASVFFHVFFFLNSVYIVIGYLRIHLNVIK